MLQLFNSRQTTNRDSGGTKLCSSPLSPCLTHWNSNERSIETDSEESLMISTRMSAKQLYFTRISCDKGGLSSAGIHYLWRGLLRGPGNNWPHQVPTPIAQHLRYQSCQIVVSRAQQGCVCQTFLLSCFWFDKFLHLIELSLSEEIWGNGKHLVACAGYALCVCQLMPAWPSVPASCLKACYRAELRNIWRSLATTSVHPVLSTDLALKVFDASWCVLDCSM